MPFAPHPYQLNAIDKIRAEWLVGKRKVCLYMPTGSGKTVVASELIRRTVAGGKRALFLAHRVELIDQAAQTLVKAGLVVGALCASAETPPNPFAPVQVATPQTLAARELWPEAHLVIADEAHHYAEAAETLCALLARYPYAVGPTATPERGDGCGLRNPWDSLVVGTTISEMQALWLADPTRGLVPCEVVRPDRPLKPGQVAQNPVDAYVEHAAGRRTIVFCRSVALANEYAAEFVLRGIRAKCVTADTPWGERRGSISALREGRIDVITNVMVATEGLDAPEVSCVMLARGCGSTGMYLQTIGRALRPAPGKRNAILIDLRGCSHEHGRPEADRIFSLDGRGIRLKDPNSYCPVCGAPRVPPAPCDKCGYEPSSEDGTKPDQVTGDALKPWMRLRETDDEDKKAERLGRWILAARSKGYKDGFWRNKYNAVYGAYPSALMVERAIASQRRTA